MDFSSDTEFDIKAVSEAQKSTRRVARKELESKKEFRPVVASSLFGASLLEEIQQLEAETQKAQATVYKKSDQEELQEAESRSKNIEELQKISQTILETRITFQSKLLAAVNSDNLKKEDPVALKSAVASFQKSALKLLRKVVDLERIAPDADKSRPGTALRLKRRAEWASRADEVSIARFEEMEAVIESTKRRKILPILDALRTKFPLSRGLATFDQAPSNQVAAFMSGEGFVRCIGDMKDKFDDSLTYTFLLKKFLTGAESVARGSKTGDETGTERKGKQASLCLYP